MQYTYITSGSELDRFCEQAAKKTAIAVDTEFVRTRTLYPKLGLIQIFDGDSLVLVDPLSISNFTSLKALLTNPNVIKVLHSCSEDLEAFWTRFQLVPAPVFDTQFAASILNMGTSLGYAKLVEEMLGIEIDKGESRTDWLARPLSEQQCAYAANDVLYLFQLFPTLFEQTKALEKLQDVYQEVDLLANKKCSQVPDEYVYLGVKNSWKLSGKPLLIMKKLAAWRVQMARQKDLALNFILREEHLLSIALKQPTSKNQLRDIQGIKPQEVKYHGDDIVEIVSQCQHLSAEHNPQRVQRVNDFSQYKQVAVSIKKLAQSIAKQQAIPVELVGSKKQINQLIKWCWFELDETRLMGSKPDLLTGWRQALFEPELLNIEGLNFAQAMNKGN